MKFYLTTPIYYASGKPHIGHAFATIYADVISRHQKRLGDDVFFSVGLDEHGQKVADKAQSVNKTPQDFVDEIAEDYKKTWERLGIDYSAFVRTTSKEHKKGVYTFFEKLRASGDIYEGFYEGLYCIDCEKFYTEKELMDGLCPDHLTKPQKVKEKNYFFNLKKYLPNIERNIRTGMLQIFPKEDTSGINVLPETRKNEVLSIIKAGIPDFSITREKVKWGIPYPYDQSQTIYVWIEALLNYVTILGYPESENFKKFWPVDLHIIGAEISKFHAIYWPALLESAGLDLPKTIFVHGLFTVNGQKMSKALGNTIDPMAMIDEFGADATRYLLLTQFPATEHGDIRAEDFKEKYNTDLANGLGNLMERVFTMIIEYGVRISADSIDPSIRTHAETMNKRYAECFKTYDLFNALKPIFTFAKQLDKYVNDTEPWKLNKTQNTDALGKALNSLYYGIQEITNCIDPFMPGTARAIRAYSKKIEAGEIDKTEKLNLFPRIKN